MSTEQGRQATGTVIITPQRAEAVDRLLRTGTPEPYTRRHEMRFPSLVTVVVAVGLCGGVAWSAPSTTSLQPAGWDASLRLAEPADLNPDPRVLEINLTAKVAEV